MNIYLNECINLERTFFGLFCINMNTLFNIYLGFQKTEIKIVSHNIFKELAVMLLYQHLYCSCIFQKNFMQRIYMYIPFFMHVYTISMCMYIPFFMHVYTISSAQKIFLIDVITHPQ